MKSADATQTIYLDNGATTPIAPEVLDGLAERQRTVFGNPSSLHAPGRAANACLEGARATLATVIGGTPDRLIFTGGGTESLGMSILGNAGATPGQIVISAVEHGSVREAARWLCRHRGWTMSEVAVDATGQCTADAVSEHLTPNVRLVCVMLANNEVGTINPIQAIAREIRAHAPRARFIVDAVQAVGKMPINVAALGADHVALTAHKLHGPKGIGALWSAHDFEPILKGGGQEHGLRGGTQSAPLAWAFATAAAAHLADMPRIAALRDRLWQQLSQVAQRASINGAPFGPDRLGNNLHLCLPGLPSMPLLNALAERGVCASSGSACGKGRFSGVLSALGRTASDGAFLRFTIGRQNTADEIDRAAAIFAEVAVAVARAYA
ncbi:MAG: cysteine desulfurase [Bradymonadia bacterium]|jgi:cysteine desulfurase